MSSDVIVRRTLLDDPAAVSMLIYLYDAKIVVGKDLTNVISNYPRLKALAQEFEKRGIVNIKQEKKPMVTIFFSLTEKGKRVAEHLIAAAEIVGP